MLSCVTALATAPGVQVLSGNGSPWYWPKWQLPGGMVSRTRALPSPGTTTMLDCGGEEVADGDEAEYEEEYPHADNPAARSSAPAIAVFMTCLPFPDTP